jgi:SpoVK/Ycf46/Vps4 family AAA+-type ATPase
MARGFIEKKESEDEDDFFGDSELFSLTDAVKADMLGELTLEFSNSSGRKEKLIVSSSITAKTLFYNKKESEKVAELAAVLDNANFKAVQKRLIDKGLRDGFVCLFFGAPGTGKTETAYQLARESGRDLMAVNVTDIQSKWVGESEKNLKAIFEHYREAVRWQEHAPILLFNEADGVISKRLELNGQSRSVDQMMNSLQSIMLEEMEKLSGVLIATTNLSQNLDKAFERRFLYKIEFEKPDSRVRQSIWRSMFPAVSEEVLQELAERFEFTGGQIENIARKSTADYVISGAEPSFERLLQLCKEETAGKPSEKSIGFF